MTIKEILAEHRISQAELCRMLGICHNTVNFWVNGKREPPDYVVKLIAYYLDHELGIPASRSNQQEQKAQL